MIRPSSGKELLLTSRCSSAKEEWEPTFLCAGSLKQDGAVTERKKFELELYADTQEFTCQPMTSSVFCDYNRSSGLQIFYSHQRLNKAFSKSYILS